MNRRDFLGGCTVTVFSLAGCSTDDRAGVVDTPTESPESPTSTPTEQPGQEASYTWTDATWDTYWYSLYNMNNIFMLSGNGLVFPRTDEQRQMFERRLDSMLAHADIDKPPVRNPKPNMAPFTTGDPHFTQQPDFADWDGRFDAATLAWDRTKSSQVVSPSSLAWTHLKGVTWAKNFQNHFGVLPLPAKFGSQMLTSIAQLGLKFALVDGGPDGNGALTDGESFRLVSGFSPTEGVVDSSPRPRHHSAMLWHLSDLTSLARGGWFGYVNPSPLLPVEKIQQLTDGVASATIERFPPAELIETGSIRDLGEMLAGIGWYGTHAGSTEMQTAAADYANRLAAPLDSRMDEHGRLADESGNQAARQGIVGQGLLWASQIPGVDHTDMAKSVLSYLLEALWDGDAGTFADGRGTATYTMSARDAGDVTGGLNAADAVLGMTRARELFPVYFDQTFNRGRLQRAERPVSRNEAAAHILPLPPDAGGKFGQSAVYNTEVEYDTRAGEWNVTDALLDTEQALYLSNQDIWLSQWGGDFYQGRGVPGESDTPK